MAYTNIDNPELYFQTKLYTGNGSTNAITLDGSENMQPDLVWLKERSSAGAGLLFDAVRTATKFVRSSDSAAEVTAADTLTAFNSDGFTLGADASNYASNQNSETYASWNWKAGTSFTNDASATGIGTIDSTGSVNDTAGFSIVSYTGTGSAGTIKHGLSTVPKMIIVKNRDATQHWGVYHVGIGNTKHLRLNSTNAASDSNNLWNNTTPTSSVFSVAGQDMVNKSGDDSIAYCFTEKKGYSKFGSYTGGSDPFVYLGFKPAFVMFKNASATENWRIVDNKRDVDNPVVQHLYPNLSNAEGSGASYNDFVDFTAQGFKIRSGSGEIDGSGNTIIYMAFAESPFVTGASAIPTTAR